MTYLLSIDPGLSTGVALGQFDHDDGYWEPCHYQLVKAWQFTGGAVGLADWFRSGELERVGEDHTSYDTEERIVICEKFTARQPLTRKMEESLRGEGWLVGQHVLPDYDVDPSVWPHPPAQYFAGGKDKNEKKRRQHAWLKEKGLYVTGKTLGQPNADDARSAIAHSIGWLRKREHMPTLKHYFKEDG